MSAPKFILFIILIAILPLKVNAIIDTYPWPEISELYGNSKYDVRIRELDNNGNPGSWLSLKEFYSTQRSYADHWKVGGDAGSDFMADRSLTFVAFAFK